MAAVLVAKSVGGDVFWFYLGRGFRHHSGWWWQA